MNAVTPRCRRCDGTRFLHSRRVLDVARRDDAGTIEWRIRPVALVRDENNVPQPVGHFETVVCRTCGYTRWYGFGWQDAAGKDLRARCAECNDETPQRRMSAVEHFANGFDQPPLTRGWLSHEGRLFITLCRRCDSVRWSGADYEQLDRTYFVHYKLRREHQRPCLQCGSAEALVDEEATELDGTTIPVAVSLPHAHAHAEAVPIGRFALRLCRPCSAVEWYAVAPERLEPNDAAALLALGGAREATVTRGPYR